MLSHPRTVHVLKHGLFPLQGGPEERSEADNSATLMTLTTTIQEHSTFFSPSGVRSFSRPYFAGVLQDSGGRYAVYHVHVKCQHTQVPVVEQWVTKRRYSDFHDLHLTLRTQVSGLSLCREDR